MKRNKEEKAIGDLKRQFVRPTLQSQRKIGISASTANGNISLGYYRGLAEGREDATKSIIAALGKKYPEAYKYLKEKFKP